MDVLINAIPTLESVIIANTVRKATIASVAKPASRSQIVTSVYPVTMDTAMRVFLVAKVPCFLNYCFRLHLFVGARLGWPLYADGRYLHQESFTFDHNEVPRSTIILCNTPPFNKLNKSEFHFN